MYIISDLLWKEIKSELPIKKSNLGRPEWSPRKTLEGVFFILTTGAQWRFLPREYGFKSTVHGKFRKWVKMGVFNKIMNKAKSFYIKSNRRLGNWAAIDTSHSKAPFANWAGKNPTDRRKHGIKKSIIVDINGAPLAVIVGPSNKHDSKFFAPTLNELNLNNFDIITADSAFDSKELRDLSQENKITLKAATNKRRKKECKNYRPAARWIVERTFGWLVWHRGIKTCWAKTKSSFLAFVQFAASAQLFRMGGLFG